MIVKDVHIHSMASACEESFLIFLVVDVLTYSRKDERPRVYGLEIAAGHLQYDCRSRRYDCNKSGSTFYAPAPFIDFRGIRRCLQF